MKKTKTIRMEIDNFISAISKEEMKYNHKLRENVVKLQELMVNPLAKEKIQSSLDLLKYLDREVFLRR